MSAELVDVFLHGDDFGIEVALESGKRLCRILRIPYRGRSHAEDSGTRTGRRLEVLAHDPVIRMVLARMVAFVKDEKRDLSRTSSSRLQSAYRPRRTLSIRQCECVNIFRKI